MQPSYDTTLQLFTSNKTVRNYDLWWTDGQPGGQTDRQTCLATCSCLKGYCQAKGLMGGCYLWWPPIVFPAGPPFPLGWVCTHSYTHTNTHMATFWKDSHRYSNTQRQEDVGLQAQTDRQMLGAYSSHIHASCSSLFTLVIPSSP